MSKLHPRPSAALALAVGLSTFAPTIFAAGPVPQSAEADETPESRQAVADDIAVFRQELVVTAAHPELPSEALYSGRQIEQQGGEDVGYFLRGQAGLSSFRRGPIGLDPQVRGLQGEQLGVFVDGTRTFAAGPGRMDSELAHVSPRAVETPRVVKGPYALTWGAGALSAIRLETFRPPFGGPETRHHARFGLAYGDNASALDGYGGAWGGGQRSRFQALAQTRSGDDYRDGTGAVIPGEYASLDGRWSFGFDLGSGTVLDYVGGYQEQKDIEYPGRQLDADDLYTRSQALELSLSPAADWLASLQAQLYANRKDHLMNNDAKPTALPDPNRVPPFGLDIAVPTESNTTGGKLTLAGGGSVLGWTAGADVYRLEQTATRWISRRNDQTLVARHLIWPDASIESLGGYFQLARRLPRHTLAATVRTDFVDAAAGEVSEFFHTYTTADLEQSEESLSLALSGQLRPAAGWTLSGGIGQVTRSASALERYSDRVPSAKFQVSAEFLGDPALEPEESLQLDLGVEHRGTDLLFQFDGYWRSIEHYITFVPDPTVPKRMPSGPEFVYRYVNGDVASFIGGELRFEYRSSERLEWHTSVSYIRGEGELFDEPVFGLPPLTARLALTVIPVERLRLDLDLSLADRQERVATARLELPTPGYSVVDLRASYVAASGWQVTAGIDNAGDRLYSHHLNSLNPFAGERIPEQGVNLHLALEYSF